MNTPKPKKIVDLSIDISASTPIYPGDPEPKITVATTIAEHGYNLNHVHIGSQTGSHVDAPYHFLETGSRIDQMPLKRFLGPGLIIPCTHKKAQEAITLSEVEPFISTMEPSTIVLFHTGWSRFAGDAQYFEHPYVDIAVVERLLELGVRTFVIDAINIDPTGGSTFPVHDAIAAANGIIAENLCNFDQIDFPNPFISLLPMKIVNADGAPVRAVAIQF